MSLTHRDSHTVNYGHMLWHAEPPTSILLWDDTRTGAEGVTEAPSILRVEKSRPPLATREGFPMWASLRLPPSAEVQPAAKFFPQTVILDRPSHLRNFFGAASAWF